MTSPTTTMCTSCSEGSFMAHGWYHRGPLLQSGSPRPGGQMRRVKKRKKIYDPRVWPTWLLVGLAWLIARLPLPAVVLLGRALGAVVFRLGRSRRRITETNLALCFPDLTDTQRALLARESFTHTALGALEAMVVWLNPGRRDIIAARTRVYGQEHFEHARAQGRGVILLGGHFSTMDVAAPGVAEIGFDVMYRENKNPVWEWLQTTGRGRYFEAVIERQDVRQTLRRLRQGRGIWYAADQDYGRKHSVFAPFFGIPTASITATARLARLNDSPVLLLRQFRDVANMTWSVHFSEPLSGYPSGDDRADATLINQTIEAAIREHPEQYLWMHRRFKTRPEGSPSFY
ncbi:MAG: LpxL/LpxP family Kdo(2)-lipid IV(A) lauroyl/palmitoleoyl acyltransferase [Gammaproteobacteria bacterium]|nr:MAG: LpxL/LpxP family Kdo(2)-lipid IV(A) lauroyl/palmitoleoyl acyltransferase [Gammaproteobacteria bacterium]